MEKTGKRSRCESAIINGMNARRNHRSVARGDILTSRLLASDSIRAGSIRAGLIQAGLIQAGLIQAGLIRAGFIRAGFIRAGFIWAGFIWAGFIWAGLIGIGLSPACAQPNSDSQRNEITGRFLWRPGVAIQFASAQDGSHLLGTADSFIQQLSPIDRRLRLGTSQAVSEAEFLAFVARQSRDWTAEEVQRLTPLLTEIGERLEPYELNWPERILLIKTTGREESGAFYTRGNAIFVPASAGKLSDDRLTRTLAHELFHVLSRHDGALRCALYRIVGFRQVDSISLPDELVERKLTNPDAPAINAVAGVRLSVHGVGEPVMVAPILYSRSGPEDPLEGKTLFGELEFRLMQVQEDEGQFRAVLSQGRAKLYTLAELPDLHRQLGHNTSYVIHPEEVLADNFVHLLFPRSTPLPDPWLVDRLRIRLAR